MDTDKAPNVSQHFEASESTEVAHAATQSDHNLSKWQAIKQNPRTFLWCLYPVVISLLVSYENQASGVVLGIPEFRKDFGSLFDGNYVIDANWQAAFSGAPLATTAFGALTAGQVADWIGRKKTLMIMFCISIVSITIEMIATTNKVFFGGKLLNGFVVGNLGAVATSYSGEIAPLALRGLLTCLLALAYTVGPLIVSIIQYFVGARESRWAYRSIFASQYGILAICIAIVPFMPESPWWLVIHNKEEAAIKSLKRLGYNKPGEAEERLAVVRTTLNEVKKETDGVTYLECFRSSNLRRTIIAIAPLSIQAIGGVIFIAGYSTYYQQLAGYSTQESFLLFIALQVVSMFGNVCSWDLVDRFGRRNMTFWGSFTLTILLLVTGGLASAGTTSSIKGAIGLMILYGWIYNISIGSTAYNLLAEVATSRLRVKTVAIGIICQSCWYVMWSFTLPYLFNPNHANLGAKIAFIFGGLSVLCTIYLWVYQVETAKRSYEELDEMFIKRVPARKFRTFVTDVELKSSDAHRRRSVTSQEA